MYDMQNDKHVFDFEDDISYGLSISPYGPYAFNAEDMKIVRFSDFKSGTPIEGTIRKYSEQTAFSPDGNYFVEITDDEEKNFGLWDIRTGKQQRIFSGHTSMIKDMKFSADSRFIVTGSLDMTVKIWNALTGALVRTLEGHEEPVYAIEISQDGKFILSGGWDLTVKLWDFATGRCIKTMYGHQNWITNLALSTDNSLALSGSYDGTARLWDLQSAKERARFIHFKDGEWIVITPEGYYMSSVNGDQYLNVRVGNQVYGIDQYRSIFYKPSIVESVLKSGQAVQVTGTTKEVDLNQFEPPFVVIKYPDDGSTIGSTQGELSVYIEDRNQSIKKVTVYINGRTAATAETRGMKSFQGVIDIEDGKKTVDLKIPVMLDPGENVIQVIASNGFSEGRKSVKVLSADKSATLKTESILPNLWMLSIGMNQYQDHKLKSLSYAVADAAGIVDAFQSQKGKLFKDVNTMIISDDAAVKPTYENIIDNLNYLKKAGANDVAVLFIAGHGLNDDTGEFYLLPGDAVLLDDGSIKRSRAISWREIRSILDFPGKKIVFVDACHSEGVSGKKTRSVDTDRFVKELQDANAVIFTSSRGNELSQESAEWGHGAFTYSIIQGLKGHANLIKDNKISMKELDTYVSETVPQITNGAQHPITSTPDGYVNFPVAIIE
jgi:WD40 repeat protein